MLCGQVQPFIPDLQQEMQSFTGIMPLTDLHAEQELEVEPVAEELAVVPGAEEADILDKNA